MKLKSEFVTYPVDDKEIMVGTGTSNFKGLVKMNATAAFIISCLKEDVSKEEIIEKVMMKYEAEHDRVEKDVSHVLQVLNSIGALNE